MASPQDVLRITAKNIKVLQCNERLAQIGDTKEGESLRTIKSVEMRILRIEVFELFAWPARLSAEPAVRLRLLRYGAARQ